MRLFKRETVHQLELGHLPVLCPHGCRGLIRPAMLAYLVRCIRCRGRIEIVAVGPPE